MPLPFTKMQAVGNDFVVIEEAVWGAGTDWAREAIRLCDRHTGIGADGLLVVCPSSVADVRMRMFNPDGTEDMCGNGLRCVVLWAAERGLLKPDAGGAFVHTGVVETLAGMRGVFVHENGAITTDMGTPLFAPEALPALLPDRHDGLDYPLSVDGHEPFRVSTVNTGSTHTVIWVDELPDDALFFAVSPQIEHHPIFPERTSVLWAKRLLGNPNGAHFDIRIWERGAGETLGCGTGACAVAVLAVKQNKITGLYGTSAPNVKIRSQGGTLAVAYAHGMNTVPHDAVMLTGTAHTVFSGMIAGQ